MTVLAFHPGRHSPAKKCQEICILGICNSYQELAIVPLNDSFTIRLLRRRIAAQRLNLKKWMELDLTDYRNS